MPDDAERRRGMYTGFHDEPPAHGDPIPGWPGAKNGESRNCSIHDLGFLVAIVIAAKDKYGVDQSDWESQRNRGNNGEW